MSSSNQFRLLSERRFAPFFATQFLGAFNDNVFRNGLIIVVTFQGVSIFGLDASPLANVAGALFILPFFVFSAIAGQLADKYEKSRLIRIIKTIEIALMSLAALLFLNDAYAELLFVLFLMGFQSAMFGPVKYAYIPQRLETTELIGGNALVESGTYLAIICGLIVGSLAVAINPGDQSLLSGTIVGIAIAGYLCSRAIPETAPVDPDLTLHWNIWRETGNIIRFARKDRSVFLSIMGISWFWLFGTAMTLQIPAYTLDILNGNEAVATILLVTFIVGVAFGSLMCEKLSGHRVEVGLVPLGSIGLTVFAVDLYFAQTTMHNITVQTAAEFFTRPGTIRILFDLTMIGAAGGLYSVPLYALIQERATRHQLSRVIAANNIVNSLFIVIAAMLALVLFNVGLSIPEFFAVIAGLNALFSAYLFLSLPEFPRRFRAWLRNILQCRRTV